MRIFKSNTGVGNLYLSKWSIVCVFFCPDRLGWSE